MLIPEIIKKKQAGLVLTPEELTAFFGGYLSGKVADYQVAAMLMACYLRGLNFGETKQLTLLARDSGKVFSWPDLRPQTVIDKHSTGGVGDKTSLILFPLALLEGVKVPMISGRALGHTGGTIDKLEAIPGLNLRLSFAAARQLMAEFGGFIMSAGPELTPLDQKLYALRDVTATVESSPLIVASILGKKLAEGISGLVMDVKYGSGAFISGHADAQQLGRYLLRVGEECGLRMRVLLSSMNSPLGRTAGNALEVAECLDVLQGKGPSDTRQLSLALAAHMVQLAQPQRSLAEIEHCLASHLDSGRAFHKFCEFVRRQGGQSSVLQAPYALPQAPLQEAVTTPQAGWITHCDVRALGLCVNSLGGGRERADTVIDPAVGLSGLKQVGEYCQASEALAVIHANDKKKLAVAKQQLLNAYTLAQTPPQVAANSLTDKLSDKTPFWEILQNPQ